MLFGGCFLRKIPREHELGFEHRPRLLDPAIQGGGHPFVDRVPDPPLHVFDRIASVAFVPGPVQVLGDRAELDDKVLAQVLRLDLAPLFSPKPDETALVIAHDDASVGAADEGASFCVHWVISRCILVEWHPAHRLLLAIAPPFTGKGGFWTSRIAFRNLV